MMEIAMSSYCRLQLALGLACALVTSFAFADGTARIAVWAIGLPHGYIVMAHQARTIDVTEEDVARGFTQIANGSRFIVTTRVPSDYAVHFAVRGSLFRSVQIEGIGRPVELGPHGGTIVARDVLAGRSVVAVSYRFRLAPGTAPGTYAWPLEIIARGALPDGFVASGPSPAPVTLSERAAR